MSDCEAAGRFCDGEECIEFRCDDYWVQVEDQCYKRFDSSMDWNDVEEDCQQQHRCVHLATIGSQHQSTYGIPRVYHLTSGDQVCIGFNSGPSQCIAHDTTAWRWAATGERADFGG